ncbi:MAG: hypothetical protein AAGA99_10150 [Actinomycetota bacterium]
MGLRRQSSEGRDGRPAWRRRLPLIAAAGVGATVALAVGAAVLFRVLEPDPETSLPLTVEVHRELTAVFVDELGEPPASVEVRFSGPDRCPRLLGFLFGSGDRRALWLEATWTSDQDLSNLHAAIASARRYLVDREGEAEGVRTDADGVALFASADTGGISRGDYEASGGGSAGGAYVRTISRACVDPATTDLSTWEAELAGSGE